MSARCSIKTIRIELKFNCYICKYVRQLFRKKATDVCVSRDPIEGTKDGNCANSNAIIRTKRKNAYGISTKKATI